MSSLAQSAGEAQGELAIQPVPPALGVWMVSHVAGFSGGGTLQKFGFGSNAGHVVRYAKCSVLVVRH